MFRDPRATGRGPVRGPVWLAVVLTAGAALAAATSWLLRGLREAMRRSSLSELRRIAARKALPPASDPAFPDRIARSVGTVITAGHRIELLFDGGGSFERLWADLAGARRSILLQVYFANEGEVTERTVEALAERARAGVTVRVLADAFGARALLQTHGDALREAGARVAAFRPLRWSAIGRSQRRAHSRIVVVDDRIGYTGGFGLDDRWLGPVEGEPEWKEANVRFEGPAVAQARAAFRIAWEETTEETDGGEDGPVPEPTDAGGVRAGILYATPRSDATAAERFLALSIVGSRRTFYAANAYFLPGRAFRELLKEAAGRGVDVRILTAGAGTDLPWVRWASRGIYTDLLRAGIRIYEYRSAMMHAKTLVVDGVWATVGSMNFDNRSLRLNEEVNLLIHDEEIGARVEAEFLADLKESREIRPAEFRRRPLRERAIEHVARVGEPLL
jgi:cardiolipin synthase A/B